MIYTVKRDGMVLVSGDWPPLTQAAWHRATRDQRAGGLIELERDGRRIASHRVTGGTGASWPDGPTCGLQEIFKGIVALLRDDGWDSKQLAAAMTAFGFPTSRSRIDGMKGSAGHPVDLSAAEIVVLLYAVLNDYKREQGDQGPD